MQLENQQCIVMAKQVLVKLWLQLPKLDMEEIKVILNRFLVS